MVTADSLHGRVVLSADGIALGEVTHVVVDPSEWRVRALTVKIRRDVADRLGLHHGVFRSSVLEISIERVQSLGDAILLAVSADALIPPPVDAQAAHP